MLGYLGLVEFIVKFSMIFSYIMTTKLIECVDQTDMTHLLKPHAFRKCLDTDIVTLRMAIRTGTHVSGVQVVIEHMIVVFEL